MKRFKIKFARQHNKSDCGVACLEMIFKYYGLNIPYFQIKKYTGTKSSGTSMMGMATASIHYDFSVKALKTENKEDILYLNKCPFIAHMNNRQLNYHYVVVYRINCDEVLVGDPEKGIINYPITEFYQDWTGKLLLLRRDNNLKYNMKPDSSFARLMSIIISEKKLISKIILFSLAGVILSILSTGYFAIIIDYILPYKRINYLHFITIAVVVLYISREITQLLKTRFTNFLAQKICIELMLKFFNHLVKLPMSFFEKYNSGEIISRFNDAELICTTIAIVIISALIDLLMVLLSAGVMFFVSYKLVLISIIPICLYGLMMVHFKAKIEDTNKKAKILNANLTSFLNESLHGVDFIKIFHSEEIIKDEMKKRFIDSSNNMIHKAKITSFQDLCKNLIYWLFITIIIWVGSTEILNNHLTVGELVAIYTILGYFLSPLQSIAGLQDSIQSTMIASDRLFEILDVLPEADEYSDTEHDLRGNIKFENVTFNYGDQGYILREFNLDIHYGSRTAIVGKSGAGKTTIARLLLKFYDYEAGRISINCNDIRTINIAELRKKIAYVPQNVFFFSGSIKDNFKLTNENITQEEMEESCKKVKIHEYINSLPYQYNTLLTENANNLSGGQRQLLSIARALVKHPDVLILDEVTSNLDSSSADVIKELVYNSLKNITIIIISHDIDFFKDCDQISILSDGKIVENGTYNELLKNNTFHNEQY